MKEEVKFVAHAGSHRTSLSAALGKHATLLEQHQLRTFKLSIERVQCDYAVLLELSTAFSMIRNFYVRLSTGLSAPAVAKPEIYSATSALSNGRSTGRAPPKMRAVRPAARSILSFRSGPYDIKPPPCTLGTLYS
jgi:hypothetical protein